MNDVNQVKATGMNYDKDRPAAKNPVKIEDLTLRDGHQSLFATRGRTEDMLPVAEMMDEVGFWAMEVWGGATFDTMHRFLNEDPWERIRTLKRYIKKTPFSMLLRGQNLVGYRNYADDVARAFVERACANGMDIFRTFDALNDFRNFETVVPVIKENGKHFQGCICYSLTEPRMGGDVFNLDYYISKAKDLEKMGADSICLKDMAGLIAPYDAYALIKALKAAVKAPPKGPAKGPAKGPVSAAARLPADGADVVDRDVYFLRDDLVRNKDGTLTWFYVTNHVAATALKSSLEMVKIAGMTTQLRKRDHWTFPYKQNSRTQDYERDYAKEPQRKVETDENVLIITFRAEYKDILEEFLDRFDVPVPQVHIKAKVVEVTLDSNLEYGVSWFFDRGGGDPNTGQTGSSNPNAFFRGFRTQFRPSSFSAAALSPTNTGLSLLFDDLSTDEGTIVATIEALQERGSANILSEPNIVATQGKLATLVTGQETPITDATITSGSERLTTRFKSTGIRLDFRPLHIGREYVSLRVRVEVSSITGFQVIESATTSLSNPVIAQRNAETVVTVRDGMTLVIGGLYSVSEIEDRTGVPILADIPLLRFLFSKRRKTKVRSELDFFITPVILRHRLARSVFVPPREKARLRKRKVEGKQAGPAATVDPS